MRGTIWVTDREPGIRLLFGELLPEADLLDPDELLVRLGTDTRPHALVIDGTQLLELNARQRSELLALPRVLVCTGLSLTSIPMSLVAGPAVSVLAKPFCVEDLEMAIEWLRGTPAEPAAPDPLPAIAGARRRRAGGAAGPTT
jgi:CheY-like chemotaxis protein